MQTLLLLLLVAQQLTCPGTTSAGYQPKPVCAPTPVTILQSPDGQKIAWEDLLHRYHGKAIYLDLWASWCGPCRQQNPYYEALKAQFARDSVVFLSISVDADPQDWQGALDAQGLNNDANVFLLLDGHHSSLNNILHIKGVPRYALLDKNGNITDKDAPFPSDPRIADRIRGLL
jgi:thiol-disulfide isomerase/thioredoxin